MSSRLLLVAKLEEIADPSAISGVRRFAKDIDGETTFMGIPINRIFPIAKQFIGLDLDEIDTLLDDPRYEVRMAAVSVMDFRARKKSTSEAERQALFSLYQGRHDRINSWGLVDRAAPYVVGEYLVDKDRSVLDKMAQSHRAAERRTAIVSTYAFIRRREISDTFRIAEILVADQDVYVQMAVASWTREAGKLDQGALVRFLTVYKGSLPRTTIVAAGKLLPLQVRNGLLPS